MAQRSLRQYFKPREGSLPDPSGPLSASFSSVAIVSANREVKEALRATAARSKKRASYQSTFGLSITYQCYL